MAMADGYCAVTGIVGSSGVWYSIDGYILVYFGCDWYGVAAMIWYGMVAMVCRWVLAVTD